MAGSRVTPLTVSQYAWVFSLGLLLTLIGVALLYGSTVAAGSLDSGTVTSRLALGLELVPALGGGLVLLAGGALFLLAGIREASSVAFTR